MPAGEWHFVGDGIILESVDVVFEVLWRHGGSDTTIATWMHHFDPLPNNEYKAQAFEATADGAAIDAANGDLLVLRMSGESASNPMAYVPNGDGANAEGRIPFLDLPPAPGADAGQAAAGGVTMAPPPPP